ncbi:MAG: OstA-like protein [Bacteroidota bacterium]
MDEDSFKAMLRCPSTLSKHTANTLFGISFVTLHGHMKNSWLSILILCLLPILSFAQQGPPTSAQEENNTRVEFIYADSTKILQGGDQQVIKHKGRVKFRQDSVILTCDSAIFINDEKVFAYDSVRIEQGDSLVAFSDYLEYDGLTRKAYLEGEVVLVNGEQQLFTDRLDYDLNTKVASYYYGATLVSDSTQLSSRRGYYYVDDEAAYFKDSVMVSDPAFYLRADTLRYSLALKTVYFLGPTLITADTSDIYTEAGFYDTDSDLAEFQENAQYQKGDRRATANTIRLDNKQQLYTLIGKAQVVDSTRLAMADTIRYFEATDESYLIGNAYFKDEKRNIDGAESIYYNAEKDIYSTTGRATIQEENQILKANNINFDQEIGFGIATGNVLWQDTSANIAIRTESALYQQDTDYLKAVDGPLGRPELISIFEDGDSLFLASDTLISRQLDTTGLDTSRILSAYNDVRFYKSDFQGLSDSMVYNAQDSMFQLFGNPVLWSDSTQFKADSISIQMANGEIDKIVLIDNAIIINQEDGLFYSQIKGKVITAYFIDGELDRLRVEGNAETVYYVKDDNGAYIGVDQSACSKMVIYFETGEIDKIKFITEPNSVLYPMTEVDHDNLRLKGFEWLYNKKPKQRLDIFAVTDKISVDYEN